MNNNTNQLYTKNLLIEFEKELNDQLIFSSFISDINVHVINENLIYVVLSSKESINYLKTKYSKILETVNQRVFNKKAKVIYIDKITFRKSPTADNTLSIQELSKKSNIKLNLLFSDYILASFNENAIKASKKIINSNEIVFSPLFIYSSSGLGKTHLLHAIGNKFMEKNKKVCYINPESFTKKIVPFLMDNNQEKINKMVDKYKSFDILIFDDIQMYAGKSSTLSVLFNIINYNLNENNQIIIASDKEPELLGGFEERFITRFQGGLTLEIKQPSFEDMIKILKHKLSSNNIDSNNWEDEALKFIVRNHSSSIRSIEGAVNRIKFYEDEIGNIKYTQKVVSKIFSTLKQEKENITKERIVDIVAKYYSLTRTDLQNKSRRKDIVLGRHISMWLIRDILGSTYKEIGAFFNGKDHSTVLVAIEKIDTKMKMNDSIKSALKKLKQKIEYID
ncbi:MAG: chromosomal replication initiator protein DnaA [Mycoplasmataceae bacterium]|nr:chromosomal replication initiator protein DnaA [Mycoplasmataceae bacterium]